VTQVDLVRSARGLEVVAEAYDPPALALDGAWQSMEMTPAALAWSLSREDGLPIVSERVAIDFRSSEPDQDVFWSVYAHGTLQNFATVGNHYRFGKPGRYRFLLTPQPIDTSVLSTGRYLVKVTALDVCGNAGSLTQTLDVTPSPEPAEIVPVPKPTEPAEPTAPAPAPTAVEPVTPPPSRVPVHWPRTEAGYTVVLASIPRAGGARAAQALAGAAREAGLGEVGVLLSDRYPSLHPGYWVVFTGVYRTSEQAQRAAVSAGLHYRGATPRPVVPRVPVRSWRPGVRGYTIVLASVPERAGLTAAREEARAAAGAGVRGVGVLRSSRFPGLQPGYFVVFAGRYASGELAQRALTRVARPYPGAYPRAIG
jgi:hypothetical protein